MPKVLVKLLTSPRSNLIYFNSTRPLYNELHSLTWSNATNWIFSWMMQKGSIPSAFYDFEKLPKCAAIQKISQDSKDSASKAKTWAGRPHPISHYIPLKAKAL